MTDHRFPAAILVLPVLLSSLTGAVRASPAPNRAHNLRTTFTLQGIRVIPRVFAGETPPWEWGMTLKRRIYPAPVPRSSEG
ncbi:MAG: hypothetical protein PVG25_10840 [Anaerolineae bacterium]|jgi:hypothetical protein